MADLEDVTLDGRPLQSLRVADLKAALEERGLSKSGQKNALVKRLKGALMLENLQRTSTPHIGLQPNSQIGEEMSQNSFIKQYLAKQQELLRQRLEREAQQAYDTNEQQDHTEVNNSTPPCPPPAQDVAQVIPGQHKAPDVEFGSANAGQGNANQEANVSSPPASGSVAARVPGVEQQQERSFASNEGGDSDDEDSEGGEEDGDDDDEDWDSSARRRNFREQARMPTARERSGVSRQPQQQHIPPLLSPQLRQPTPPPSPPPELSFPLPDTPKQSPPSPDVAPARHSPSSSSSGSSSSGSRSSSPEPQRSVHAERKPGPLTLLARKMESEGAFSGASWRGAEGQGDVQENSSSSATPLANRGPAEALVSAITHTANTAGHLPFPILPGTHQGVPGVHPGHMQVPVSVLRAAASDERDRELQAANEKALELERHEKMKKLEQERAAALAQEEREKALERERLARQQALEREKALQREREAALEKERQEREQALAKEREELERQKELERQRALEQERLQREMEERERLERERKQQEMEKALEQARLKKEREEAERKERERALELERLERERLERDRVLELARVEREKIERERAEEQERVMRERALEQERLEQERKEKERIERERALELERVQREEKERIERERVLEQERARREMEEREEKERVERERALEQQRLQNEKQQRAEEERQEKERALEQERVEREKKERAAREAALERERLERERAEREKEEQKRAQEQEDIRKKRNLEMRLEEANKLRSELERKKAEEQERKRALELEKLEKEKTSRAFHVAEQKEKRSPSEMGGGSLLSPPRHEREVALTQLPNTPLLSTGAVRNLPTEAGEQERASEAGKPDEAVSPSASSSSHPPHEKSVKDLTPQPKPASSSLVIKRPRTFSTTPQGPVPSATPCGDAGERQLSPSKQGGPQIQTNQEAASIPQKAGEETQEKEKEQTQRAEQEEKEKTLSSTIPAGSPAHRSGDTKNQEKKRRRGSSSSNSSESDSGSSPSRSPTSSSSSSSQDQIFSRDKQGSERGRAQVDTKEVLNFLPKSSFCEEDAHVVSSNNVDAEGPKQQEASKVMPERESRRSRTGNEEDEEKRQQRESKEAAGAEKVSEATEETPKVFSARKITLGNSKSSPGSVEGESDTGGVAGRKRRWGASTAVTAKKPSISITTDSLKSLIPDIKPCLSQEAVVDLHPEETVLSAPEEEEEDQQSSEQDLQIRRTVTQVVHSETSENGQKEAKRSRQEDEEEESGQPVEDEPEEKTKSHQDKMEVSHPRPAETESPVDTSHDMEINTVSPSDALIRRSISQQKTGVCITIDDPVRTVQQPSPPRGKVSNIVHVCNLVRPFTLGQLKELLGRTGALVDEGFWIDKIKSHCYVTYSSTEEAVATRTALHGVKWPQSNPKVLTVDFCQQDELDFHKGLGSSERPAEDQGAPSFGRGRASGPQPLLPEREQWAEREREMERKERARAEREWDRDKVREFGKAGEPREAGSRRSRSRERRRKERGKSKEKKAEKKAEDPPAKLLDDLFCKTKSTPCIYWLPLTEEQYQQRQVDRAERMKEREKRRKELEEKEEQKKKEEERKERAKAAASGERNDGERNKDRERDRERGGRDREKEKEREREDDKRRDGHRRPGAWGAGSSRRSRSRSDPRERRR